MDTKKSKTISVSVIIPACNEEGYLERTLQSVKKQTYAPIETIVVVNGSTDRTEEIARRLANKVLVFEKGIGPARARNEGVKEAIGDVFVFLDGDSRISNRTVAQIVNLTKKFSDKKIFGTCKALPSKPRFEALVFFHFKNFIHMFGFYKGFLALCFCDRELFFECGSFDPKRRVGEFKDFTERALNIGGVYMYAKGCSVTTSIRRYEKDGYFATLWFWTKWAFLSPFRKIFKIKPIDREYRPVR